MMSNERSAEAEVRNPLLSLPAMQKIRALPAPARQALAELLVELHSDAERRAQVAWNRSKAPMAAYWKSVAVYTLHIHRALRK